MLLLAGCCRPDVTTIAVGSCSNQAKKMPHWASIAAQDPELVILMGDNVYGDVDSGDPAVPELRAAYEKLGANPDFATLRDEVPILQTWDDHDYATSDGGAEWVLKEQAEAAFLEFWRVPVDDPRRTRPGVYFARTTGEPGRRVQIILLDTRTFRSPLLRSDDTSVRGKERYMPDPDVSKTILGDVQWAWLKRQLRQPADVRLLVSSIQVLAEDHGYECWNNLPSERARLIALLRDTGAIILSGDRHSASFMREGSLTEFTSSALNLRSMIKKHYQAPNMLGPAYKKPNFGTVEIDWSAGKATLSIRRSKSGDVVRSVDVPTKSSHRPE